MSRTPLAMRTLIRQVESLRPSAETELRDLDGLNVYRTVAFDEKTSEWIEPLAEVFASDERIDSYERVDGSIFVTFVADPRADRAKPDFVLAGIEAVLNDEPEQAENASLVERADARRKELQAIPVAKLREDHGYDPDEAHPSKSALISEILTSEGFGTS